jgi:hypothetical protein
VQRKTGEYPHACYLGSGVDTAGKRLDPLRHQLEARASHNKRGAA